MRILSIFLTLMVLIAGVLSCADPTADEPYQYNLTVSSSGGGSVITPGEDTFAYEDGAVVDLVATADDGYHFVEWKGDVDTVASVTAATTTITMEGDYWITANFAEIPTVRYSLTVSSTTGGSVIAPGEGTFTYDADTVVDLVAEADTGYRFVNWTGDAGTIAEVDATTTSITINGDYNIAANFGAQYVLTIDSTEGGSVTTPGEGTFTYDAGTVVDLEAVAEDRHGFAKWTGDISDFIDVSSASTYIVVNGDCSVTASFGLGISDWHDLHAIRDDLSGSYVLMNDLDSNTAGYVELARATANGGRGWQPIGSAYWDPEGAGYIGEFFVGIFNGRGYEVRDMFINRPDEDMVGLFGFVGEGGVIEGVGVVDSDVTGWYNVGGLVGHARLSTIDSSYSIGSVTGYVNVGGLVGIAGPATVSNSYSDGEVTGVGAVGGLAGQVHGPLVNSYYDYDQVLINGEKAITAGALFGEDFEEWLASGRFLDVDERLSQQDGYYLINSVSDFRQLLAFGQGSSLRFRLTSDLDLGNDPDFYIPYLAGDFDGDGHTISNLTFGFGFVSQVGLFGALRGSITKLGVENVDVVGHHFVGGLVGSSGGAISGCYSTGRVSADYRSGGLIGGNWGTVSNCYSTCTTARGGGLVGSQSWGAVSDCYSAGRVTGDDGGLVQVIFGGTVSDSFWDTQTSLQNSSTGGTGKTTAQMRRLATFADTGTLGLDQPWDIVAVANPNTRNSSYVWNIVDGQTYPFLSWQQVP